jgi:hypothetical protein
MSGLRDCSHQGAAGRRDPARRRVATAKTPPQGRPGGGRRSCRRATAGAARQRNFALESLERDGALDDPTALVAFFDDDFRPDPLWFSNACIAFADQDIVAITGTLLADGVVSGEISEAQAETMLDLQGRGDSDRYNPEHPDLRHMVDLYGCNMMVRATALKAIRFDEALPLYSWLEDLDLQAQLVRRGRTAGVSTCNGVHLGTRGGRTSGVRFGYSQIANPVYLAGKGSMSGGKMLRFAMRALASNIVFSMKLGADIDYFGRLKGNCKALVDVVTGRVHPSRILNFN